MLRSSTTTAIMMMNRGRLLVVLSPGAVCASTSDSMHQKRKSACWRSGVRGLSCAHWLSDMPPGRMEAFLKGASRAAAAAHAAATCSCNPQPASLGESPVRAKFRNRFKTISKSQPGTGHTRETDTKRSQRRDHSRALSNPRQTDRPTANPSRRQGEALNPLRGGPTGPPPPPLHLPPSPPSTPPPPLASVCRAPPHTARPTSCVNSQACNEPMRTRLRDWECANVRCLRCHPT